MHRAPSAADETKARCCPAWPTDRQRRGRARRRRSRSADGTASRIGRGGARRRAGRRAPRAGRRRRGDRRRRGRRRDGRDAAEPRPDPPLGARHASTAPPPTVIAGARQALVDLARDASVRAEATGIARECTELAAEYAKEREQFGRPIAMFQAVKHHCANMLVATELATAAVWDAARAAGVRRRSVLATPRRSRRRSPLPAADLCANLNIQVHGGIGFTWEHDAHLYLRRATALVAIVDPEAAAIAVDRSDPRRRASRAGRSTCRPRPSRSATRCGPFVDRGQGPRRGTAQRERLIETGYVMPHWPKPWGRAAGAVEQLVIEQEFAARPAIKRPPTASPAGSSSRSSSTPPTTRSPAGCVRRSPRR